MSQFPPFLQPPAEETVCKAKEEEARSTQAQKDAQAKKKREQRAKKKRAKGSNVEPYESS